MTGEGGNGGDGAATAVAAPRVNSRTVEDRNQQHMSAGLGFALLERILNSALNKATAIASIEDPVLLISIISVDVTLPCPGTTSSTSKQ